MESKQSLSHPTIPTTTGRVKKVSLRFIIAVILFIILLFTYFIAKDLFISITVVLFWPFSISLSLFLILSPFIYIWRLKKSWSFLNICIALISAVILTIVVYFGWVVFLNYMFDVMGEALLSTF